MMKGYDIVGNIAIVKFERDAKKSDKIKDAKNLVKQHSNISSVLEKSGKFSGRLRTLKTKFVYGIDTKEVVYKENNCVFRFNVDTCYFSPRLSTERLELANMVKKGEEVLVLFAGVAPFSIVIAKNSKPSRVVSVELGRECKKYAIENVKKNKTDNVEIVQGDVRRILPKMHEKFDRVVMSRPNLKDSFLDVSFPRVKKGGFIHYYGFYEEDKLEDMIVMIEKEAKKAKRKIKILKVKKAGDIGKHKYRYRADIKMLN